jgi:hypothetical protein
MRQQNNLVGGFKGKAGESYTVVPFERDLLESAKLPFEAKLTFLTTILLFYPVCLLCLLHSKPAVRYWFGHWTIVTAAGVVLWIIFCNVALKTGYIRRGLAAIVAVVIPSATLAGVCQVQAWQFSEVSAALVSSDCSSFGEKAMVQRAWQVAFDLKVTCTLALANATGVTPQDASRVLDMRDCPDYPYLAKKLGSEFAFLEHLEKNYHCGGWCTPARPIWRSTVKTVQDSCSLSFGRALGGNISLLGIQITIYSLILLGSASLLLLLAPKSMAAA